MAAGKPRSDNLSKRDGRGLLPSWCTCMTRVHTALSQLYNVCIVHSVRTPLPTPSFRVHRLHCTFTTNLSLTRGFWMQVPIAYYGTEQGMAGGQSDNDKRQPQWQHGGYTTSAPLYQWTARLVAARKAMLQSLNDRPVDGVSHLSVTSDGAVFSFVRGGALAVSCRQGYSGRVVVKTAWENGTRVCDWLMPNASTTPAGRRTPPTCDASAHRLDCGRVGTNQSGCESSGCCWSPVNPNPLNKPWCYHPNGGPAPPGPPPPPPLSRCSTVAQDGTVAVEMTAGQPRVFIVGAQVIHAHRGASSLSTGKKLSQE
jgi:hypothetical protein